MRMSDFGLHIVIGLVFATSVQAADAAASRPASTSPRTVIDYGAAGDGRTKDTVAIQRAIDAAAAAGGGTVVFPAGRYLSGTLVLKDHVTLGLENGAVLLGSTDLGDYPRHRPAYRSYTETYVNQALIYAENAQHVGLAGGGTIDGQGGHANFRVAPGEVGYLERPYLVRFINCRDVRVEGITLRDSPMWVQHYMACDRVTIRGITVASNVNHNNDMLDIDGCRDVHVSGCTGDTGDDAITLKSTGERLCENVVISDCTVGSNCNGIKMGTETTGGFRNITITNCAIRPSRSEDVLYSYRQGSGGIALQMVDGGILENVTISNIAIQGTLSPIFIRLGNRARRHIAEAPAPGQGKLRNVLISNVVATGAGKLGCPIAGLPDACIENVTLRDVRITAVGGGTLEDAERQVEERPADYPECTMFGTLPAYGFFIRHVRGLTLDNVQVGFDEADLRPALVCDDVQDLRINGFRAMVAEGATDVVSLAGVAHVLISGCIAPRTAATYLRLAGESSRAVFLTGSDLSRAAQPYRFTDGARPTSLSEAANRLPRRD